MKINLLIFLLGVLSITVQPAFACSKEKISELHFLSPWTGIEYPNCAVVITGIDWVGASILVMLTFLLAFSVLAAFKAKKRCSRILKIAVVLFAVLMTLYYFIFIITRSLIA